MKKMLEQLLFYIAVVMTIDLTITVLGFAMVGFQGTNVQPATKLK